MRVAQLADLVEVHDRTYGPGGAEHLVRDAAWRQFDPDVADVFLADPTAFWLAPRPGAIGTPRSPRRPTSIRTLTPAELDRMLDRARRLRRPQVPVHPRPLTSSRRSCRASRRATRPGRRRRLALRRAGHVHDIGRIGCSNRIWEHAGDLSAEHWERVRLHPYLTAGSSTGQRPGRRRSDRDEPPRAARRRRLPAGTRCRVTSGCPTGSSPRPSPTSRRWSPARTAPRMTRRSAADRLRRTGPAGALDVTAVNAVLAAAGIHARSDTARRPAHAARGRDPASRRAGPVEPADRPAVHALGEDGAQPRGADLRQARRQQPHRGQSLRPRARARAGESRSLGHRVLGGCLGCR